LQFTKQVFLFSSTFLFSQIIDPHYENDSVQQPENRLLRVFYNASKLINVNMWIRHAIFLVVVTLVISSAVLDVVRAVFCDLELTV
jgi:hypothetical protein